MIISANSSNVIYGGKVPATAERLPAKYLVKEEAPKIHLFAVSGQRPRFPTSQNRISGPE
jgi:hypothetical protein